MTVFTTVGFGDISAKSEAARLVVTLQMLLDLLLLGLVVKLFFSAIKRSQQRQVAQGVGGEKYEPARKMFTLNREASTWRKVSRRPWP